MRQFADFLRELFYTLATCLQDVLAGKIVQRINTHFRSKSHKQIALKVKALRMKKHGKSSDSNELLFQKPVSQTDH